MTVVKASSVTVAVTAVSTIPIRCSAAASTFDDPSAKGSGSVRF